jgi:hypothetical protein
MSKTSATIQIVVIVASGIWYLVSGTNGSMLLLVVVSWTIQGYNLWAMHKLEKNIRSKK